MFEKIFLKIFEIFIFIAILYNVTNLKYSMSTDKNVKYKVITKFDKRSVVNGTFTTFSEAKFCIKELYDKEFWSGNICTWINDISYYGRNFTLSDNKEFATTFIKKYAE